MKLYPRDQYLRRLIGFEGTNIVRVLTGMRRSGKSSILLLYKNRLLQHKGIAERNIVYINFESLQSLSLTEPLTFYEEIKKRAEKVDGKIFLLFDEIQNVKEWEKVINSFRVDFDCEMIVTGSNAHLLSGELSTHLAGRYVEIRVYPLSFDEFLEFRNGFGESENDSFQEFLRFGSLPGLQEINGSSEAKNQYLGDIFNSVLLKDVISRYNVRDTELLNRIVLFLMDNIGSLLSAKKISEFLKSQGRRLSTETVYNYLDFLESAFVIERVKRFDIKGKRFLETQEKIYLTDIGVRNALLGYRPNDISALLENAVFLRLRQSGFQVYVGKQGDTEVDFVAVCEDRRIYIQVCYMLTPENQQREFAPLKSIKDNHLKMVLTLSPLVSGNDDGIIVANLMDFLKKPGL